MYFIDKTKCWAGYTINNLKNTVNIFLFHTYATGEGEWIIKGNFF